MQSNEIRSRFLRFFESRGHKIIPSSSLVPENDPSVLFTTAGMQQFKQYYTNPENADKDFGNKNIVTVQKCVRTGDIDEVGDDTHLTFFEMLGNFSFGGYWKKEAIQYAYDFVTKELGLTIDYVSVFSAKGGPASGGEGNIPDDTESENIWRAIDSKIKIIKSGKEDNFWGPTGNEGPCGPTTEICINGVEIWNIVFNEFYKTKEGKYRPLGTKGVDTGMGLERLLVQVQKKNNVYETDLFTSIMTLFPKFIPDSKKRIIADHAKTSAFLIADGVIPSNKDRGYILRRLLRRMIVHLRTFGNDLFTPIGFVIDLYAKTYHLDRNIIFPIIKAESDKFEKTLAQGLKEFEKGADPFILATTYGFPIELTMELAKEKGQSIDLENFNQKMAEHQKLSQTASSGMFKGGLAN